MWVLAARYKQHSAAMKRGKHLKKMLLRTRTLGLLYYYYFILTFVVCAPIEKLWCNSGTNGLLRIEVRTYLTIRTVSYVPTVPYIPDLV